MKLDVRFERSKQTFNTEFGVVHNISDGGYERGYAEGYAVGDTEGYDKGHKEGVEQGYSEGVAVGTENTINEILGGEW